MPSRMASIASCVERARSVSSTAVKTAAMMTRKSPIEQRRARAANMQKAGRRGGKAGYGFGVGHGHPVSRMACINRAIPHQVASLRAGSASLSADTTNCGSALMHIGQFSLVICSFVLAVTSYFIWPYEPSRLVPILILAGAVPLSSREFSSAPHLDSISPAPRCVVCVSAGRASGPSCTCLGALIAARIADEIVVLRQRGINMDRLARHHGVAVGVSVARIVA